MEKEKESLTRCPGIEISCPTILEYCATDPFIACLIERSSPELEIQPGIHLVSRPGVLVNT